MSNKTVMVRLRGDNGDLNRALLGSAAASEVLEKNLDKADGSSRRLSNSLETSNDRTTMLVQSALALGPALVPIGAQAVPIVAGLATQMGFATAAIGVTVLAFQGMGNALKAVNQYQIEPTTENFLKMREALDTLGPDGQKFVQTLQSLRPELQQLQNIAQQGMFPGAEKGLTSILDLLPQIEDIVGVISHTLGDLLAEGGKKLDGPEWRSFFAYIESDAQPILTDMTRTAGNFVLGIAKMVEAFGPMTREFSQGLLGVSQDFAKWSAGLADTQGFQDFLVYIDETGPQVWDTLGAIAKALVAIVEAAAPVGRVSLPILEALANTLAAIASTPIGPILIGVAAGVAAVSRAVALFETANGSALLGSMLGSRGAGAAAATVEGGAAAAAAARVTLADRFFNASSMRGAIPAMREYQTAVTQLRVAETEARAAHINYLGGLRASSVREELYPGSAPLSSMTGRADSLVAANERQAASAKRVADAERAKSAAFRESAAGVGKATALMGGLALATSGYADKTGAANTVSLALMGTLGGPFGVAIGAAIGIAMDMAAANNNLEDSFNRLDLAVKTATPTATGVASLQANVQDAQKQLDQQKATNARTIAKGGAGMGGLGYTLAHPQDSYLTAKNSIEGWFGKSDIEENQARLDRAQKVLDKVRGEMIEAANAADQWRGAVGSAGIAAGLTATEVHGLVAAMQEQRKAALGAFDAETQYRSALKAAHKQAASNNAGIRGSSEAALKNRSALSQLAAAWDNQSDSVRNNMKRFREARQSFIDTAVAMGVPREAARKLAKQLLDIPTRRVIQIAMTGDHEVSAAIRRIIGEMASIHDKTVRLNYFVNQVNTVNRGQLGIGSDGQRKAHGGLLRGPGGPMDDRIPLWGSDGEYMVRAAAVQHYGLGFFEAANAMRLANGGMVSARRAGGGGGGGTAALSLVGMRVEGRMKVDLEGGDGYFRGIVQDEMAEESDYQRNRSPRP